LEPREETKDFAAWKQPQAFSQELRKAFKSLSLMNCKKVYCMIEMECDLGSVRHFDLN
jgi:hypothetical protein